METVQQKCWRKLTPWMSEYVASAMTTNKSTPSYWRTLRSKLEPNIGRLSVQVSVIESYGSIPRALLRAIGQNKDALDEVLAAIDAKRALTFSRILAVQTDISVIDVSGASDDIQLDQPKAISAALGSLLAPRAKSVPTPLSDWLSEVERRSERLLFAAFI